MELQRIIIIDDDPLNNFIFREMVAHFNKKTEVFDFQSAEAGLEFISKNYPDYSGKKTILFLDLAMPRMDGWEFLDHFDEFDSMTKNAFIINILSSSIKGEDKEKAGFSPYVMEYVNKPFSVETLKRVIHGEAVNV
jgi:CheY-like chemotaxis protein